MKWNVHHASFILLIASCPICFADASQIIYGLDKARHFYSQPRSKDVYIQIGSFIERSKALRAQQTLKGKTNHPVKISKNGKYYTVLIGPLRTASEIRKTANLLAEKTPFYTKNNSTLQEHYTSPEIIPFIPSPIINAASSKILKPSVSTSNWFASIGAGGQFPISSDNMVVNNDSGLPAPYYQDTYTLNNHNGAVFALAAGYRWEQNTEWIPSYSLEVQWQDFFSINPSGTITQYSTSEFTNYNYNWDVNSNILLAIAKLNLFQYERFSPYINGGVGTAFNSTGGYKETALTGITPRDTPGFTNNTSSQFAYQIGAGIDLQVSPKIIFSLGYNYQNIGRLLSGPGINTWANESLRSESIGSNEILVRVNYLFGK